jgi:hypothetical protein
LSVLATSRSAVPKGSRTEGFPEPETPARKMNILTN